MGFNDRRARAIRESTFGKDVRKPIADAAQFNIDFVTKTLVRLSGSNSGAAEAVGEKYDELNEMLETAKKEDEREIILAKELGVQALSAQGKHSELSEMLENAKEHDERAVNQAKDQAIDDLNDMKAAADTDLDRLSKYCGYRISSCTTTPITGKDGYYTLNLRRENGTQP